MATETKEGWTITTWSVYLRRGELLDMDTGEKTGAIGHQRGLSVATRRLTQVDHIHKQPRDGWIDDVLSSHSRDCLIFSLSYKIYVILICLYQCVHK